MYKKLYKLHIGPGPHWRKPDESWINIDVDPTRADIVVNFQDFVRLPFENETVECIYASHILEHVGIFNIDNVLCECCRVLRYGGVMRVVLPDAEKSIREYLAGNADFSLFKRRIARAKANYGLDYTLFDCLREDFVSRSSQSKLLGQNALGHQNAWDFESIKNDLLRAGFTAVSQRRYQQSSSNVFDFEGTYKSEANEHGRSLYVEAIV